MSLEAWTELVADSDQRSTEVEGTATSTGEGTTGGSFHHLQISPTCALPSLPRYVPCPTAASYLAVWHDCREDQYVALCPECQRLVAYDTLQELYCEMVWGECCQGCRARLTFKLNPGLIGKALTCWYTTGRFPQSPSWLESLPHYACNQWAAEIEAGLEAATAPAMRLSVANGTRTGSLWKDGRS